MSAEGFRAGAVRAALSALGIRRLLLGVFDAAFPPGPEGDLGRGSPSGEGGRELLRFASSLGFDGIQLGPQGLTSAGDPSPYDGALFSRDPLSIPLLPLTRAEGGELLRRSTLEDLVAGRPEPRDRAAHAYAFAAMERALDEAYRAFARRRGAGEGGAVAALAARLESFRAREAGWLLPDALYDVLSGAYGGASWRGWSGPSGELDRRLFAPAPGEEAAARVRRRELLTRNGPALERFAFAQLLAEEAHAGARQLARSLGLALFGDLQVGMSERDAWAAQALLFPGLRIGAPPSRTNPEGQAWGYHFLDPRLYRNPGDGAGQGPALRFFTARVARALAAYDGLRIDHPHGLVTPWVYRDDGHPQLAVRSGTRLFAAPDLPDFPELAPLAIARSEQLDLSLRRHADGFVRALDEGQVERYGVLLDALMELARAAGLGPEAVPCEILSTQPYPLQRVIERQGLGRFRVTQKADLDRADDVYRGENARPEDWILLGNHDTPPIHALAESWVADGSSRWQAEYLAWRLLPDGKGREDWVVRTAASPGALAQAKFAELFVGPARQVYLFFSDLFGTRESYNVPGTVSGGNWSLRIPSGFEGLYRERLAEGRALDLPRALAQALRARGEGGPGGRHASLVAELDPPAE